MPAKKKDFWNKKNISRICLETIQKIINGQLDIKLGQFMKEELDAVLKKIKSRKVADLDEIPLKFRWCFLKAWKQWFSHIDFFNIVAVVLQGDTLAPYLFIFCLDYAPQMSIDLIKENGFTFKKRHVAWYPAEIMTDAENTDNLEFFFTYTNTSRVLAA